MSDDSVAIGTVGRWPRITPRRSRGTATAAPTPTLGITMGAAPEKTRKAPNPEQQVIDEIDALVDESLARGVDEYGAPLDNYTIDRYPDCDRCPHNWHGLDCAERGYGGQMCGCPGEHHVVYTDQIESVEVVEAEICEGHPLVRYWRTNNGELQEIDLEQWSQLVDQLIEATMEALGQRGISYQEWFGPDQDVDLRLQAEQEFHSETVCGNDCPGCCNEAEEGS